MLAVRRKHDPWFSLSFSTPGVPALKKFTIYYNLILIPHSASFVLMQQILMSVKYGRPTWRSWFILLELSIRGFVRLLIMNLK